MYMPTGGSARCRDPHCHRCIDAAEKAIVVAHDDDRSIKLVHNRLWGRRGENVREICGRERTSGFLAAVKPEGYELLDHDKVAVEHAPLLPVELNGNVDLHWATRLCCQAAHPIFHVDPVSEHTIRWRCAFISSSLHFGVPERRGVSEETHAKKLIN